jgi:hypothetical protein
VNSAPSVVKFGNPLFTEGNSSQPLKRFCYDPKSEVLVVESTSTTTEYDCSLSHCPAVGSWVHVEL